MTCDVLVLFEFNNKERAKEKVKDVYNIFNKIKAATEWIEDRDRDKKTTYMHQLKERCPVVYEIFSFHKSDDDIVDQIEISFNENEWDINYQCVIFTLNYYSPYCLYEDMDTIGGMVSANSTFVEITSWEYWDDDYDFWYYRLHPV